ncbi:beta-lactamase/transpeptidase-like protein [Gilbertella persicaria]|uniref:Beta-lactamase-related domain-containing protein n=1 Tax=Rhizopus stolonifer TaxID=4846 RepID=A0A367IZE2_RHIST|nr:beta-lactamase/transpeptidase-like protein [Gilbertella persicaria]KAI8072161.1 beta-lactamase/transpeptidase-like protein [Gilbertella persicaria]RCH83054.1 hypothetical protein CU098_007352 [Rhizopus stolonifer]
MPSLFQVTTLTIPLLSYALYQYANSGPYLSTTCALFRYGCPTDIPVHGFYDKAYQEAYDLFLENFKQGLDIGAGLSVYVDGVSVINVQAGWQDIENKIEYTNKTLQMVFSCTKTLSAILIAQLVEQNLLSYDEKISTYWPEFAQGKKENVTVMDLMRHTAGVGALDYPISLANVTDPVTFANILASQPHNFDGVPTHAYHAITQGWYQNEIVRRVTGGKTLDDLARTLKDKYGSEWYLKPDVTEGVDTSRIAPFYEQPILHQLAPFLRIYLNPFADKTFIRNIFDKDSLFTRSLVHANIDQQRGVMNNRDPIRRAIEGPSYSGHTNAESVNKTLILPVTLIYARR